jgi:myosin-crossreactive antigen
VTGSSNPKVYLVGRVAASLAAAACVVRDARPHCAKNQILEELSLAIGSMDGVPPRTGRR